jgi:hypothetical protein
MTYSQTLRLRAVHAEFKLVLSKRNKRIHTYAEQDRKKQQMANFSCQVNLCKFFVFLNNTFIYYNKVQKMPFMARMLNRFIF